MLRCKGIHFKVTGCEELTNSILDNSKRLMSIGLLTITVIEGESVLVLLETYGIIQESRIGELREAGCPH